MKKILFVLTFVIVSVFAFGGKALAATSFPDSITAHRGELLGNDQGYHLYAKTFSAGSVSQSAICTSFNRYAPSEIKCTPVAWSNNSYNDKVAGAVGAVIYAARNNKSTGAMSWDNYYYAELAINNLLYLGYANGRGYGSIYNKLPSFPSNKSFNLAKYQNYLSVANYAFYNYGKIKVTVTNPSFNSSTGVATATVKCTDYKGNGTGCNLKTKQISYFKDGTWQSVPQSSITVGSATISAPIPAGAEKVQFSVVDRQCYHTAMNYNCGSSYQSLTPNFIKDQCAETSAKSSVIVPHSEYKLHVHKKDASGNPLKGATVKITRNGENYINENDGFVELVDGQIDYNNVEEGRYCITEVRAPEGYSATQSQACVDINESHKEDTITIINEKDPKNLTINKVDENGTPVVGAKIKVYYIKDDYVYNEDEDSEDVSDALVYLKNTDGTDYWITDGNPIVIEGLDVNRTYTVTEVELPKDGGYAGSDAKEITISDDSSKNVVTLTNTHSIIKISKQSITSTKELPGAELIITDSRGNQWAKWTSGDKPAEISGLVDGDYTLTELTAPQGYTIAESVNFTVENGVVKGDEDNTVVMKDATIVEVPDTFNVRNIIAMISGLVLVAVGTGVLFYETKKKNA